MADSQPTPEERTAPERPKMVGWYNPPHLISIAIRVAISTIFGQFADRRESLAVREVRPDDYTRFSGQDFWFDFVADCGDGWNPTYAIAQLLAEPTLPDVGGLPRGSILVMGGDEVYPTASREEYETRLIAPYDQAYSEVKKREGWPDDRPHLYAIPGNHDWYDSLVSFLDIFCRRRIRNGKEERAGKEIGGRDTQQTRSYFALKLPGDWWLWAVDIQLTGYIDQPQVDFFIQVVKEEMTSPSKLIICTGQPVWLTPEEDANSPGSGLRSFSYLARLHQLAAVKHQVRLVLTGDLHHYSHYEEDGVHFLTCGGGGAFLHPTHRLKDNPVRLYYPAPNDRTHIPSPKAVHPRRFTLSHKDEAKAVYPSVETSARLVRDNWKFAYLNPWYALTIAIAYAIFTWLMHTNALLYGPFVAGKSLALLLQSASDFGGALGTYVSIAGVSPWPFLFFAASIGGYYYLADFRDLLPRLTAGVLHALVQSLTLVIVTCAIARTVTSSSDLLLIVLVGLVGGLLSATLLGLYFWFCLWRFGKHSNEAFSSLRIQDYKSFLRLQIKPNGDLTVYPIGIDRIPQDGSATLKPRLVDGPISINGTLPEG
jgi:hypothetical protein